MFTGVIRHSGRVRGFRRGKEELRVEAPGLAGRVEAGGSVAVNGVCLSLVRADRDELVFGLSRETLDRAALGDLGPGDAVNLELPLTPASPIDGHLVSGHVDFAARIIRVASRPPGRRMRVALPPPFRPFLVEKGSVAVDGVSLTVAGLGPGWFEVELIPLTLEGTNLGRLRAGRRVNVECDTLGKYVYNWLSRNEIERRKRHAR